MDFMKKLKIRFWLAAVYILIGAAMFVIGAFFDENDFLSSFGFAFVVMGIARMRNYLRITKNEETIKKQRIAETDERNIAIASKARGVAFGIYILVAAAAVVIFRVLNMTDISKIISYSVCTLVLIYWLSYLIISRRS